MYTLAGFAGAALAGAWLGYQVEWLSASGGWDEMHRDEMHLAFATARGAFLFVLAGAISLIWRPTRLSGRVIPLLVVSAVGSAIFEVVVFVPGSVDYYQRFPDIWRGVWRSVVLEYTGRSIFFALQAFVIMLGTVLVARLADRATRSDDAPNIHA